MSEPVKFVMKYTVHADMMGFESRSQLHWEPSKIVCWRCAPPLWHNTLTDVHGMKVTPILVTDPHAEKLMCELCHETLSAPCAEEFPGT